MTDYPLGGRKVGLAVGTLGVGGAERQAYYLIKALLQAGAKPRVYCLTQGEFWESPIRELGVPVVWIGRERGIFRRLKGLIRELKKDRPDVLQSTHFYMNPYVALAGRWLGIRDIGASRSDVKSDLAAQGRWLGQICLKGPRRLALNSRKAILNAREQGVPEKKLFFLPNVLDLSTGELSLSPSPSARNDGKIRLLTAGRLDRHKRVDWFVRAAADLVKEGFEVEASIAGDGPERESLERLAHDLGLQSPQIQFLGQVSQMAQVYAGSDIFVLPSEFEGTPNVVLEAMAHGLAVVSTRVGDVPDLIDHGKTGMIADVADSQSLRTLVKELARDRMSRETLGRQARAAVERDWSMDRLIAHLVKLYQ